MEARNEEYHKNTIQLPRILCLHGGGSNARTFKTQCRVISRMLAPYFRLVYSEAPLDSMPGPDVLLVYADYGPFKRWFPEHEVEDGAAIKAIDNSIKTAMVEDDRSGARGPWVGLLGFSQGAKLAASLLFRQQIRAARLDRANAGSDWKFAVLMAGAAPIISLDPHVFSSSMLSSPSQAHSLGSPKLEDVTGEEHVLRIPTIHVHGLADPGLHLHRELLEDYCSVNSARVLEWDGAHRVPVKSADVKCLVEEILNLAKEIGCDGAQDS